MALLLLFSTIFSISNFISSAQNTNASACKCSNPSESCWPSADAWKALNSSIAGRLLVPIPAALPCYKDTFDNASCSIAMSRWSDPSWRIDQAGAVQYANWELLGEDGCPLNTTAAKNGQCRRGNLPEYSVRAATAGDVQAAVRFAAKYRLKLKVRGGAHSYHGQSTEAGSMVVWTRDLRNISFSDDFRPAGCNAGQRGQSAVKVHAGDVWEDVYRAADTRKVVVVGAMSGTVAAAGGYVQGGGHGPISHMFGLAADNVLEFEVVTADGELVVANACQNQDLFWALRGGGGGTFGVVVSATYRTFPAFSRVIGTFVSIIPANAPSLLEVTRHFIEIQGALSDENWAGYFEIRRERLFFGYLIPNGEASQVNETLGGFLSYVRQQQGLTIQVANVKEFPSFLVWRQAASCAFFGAQCVESTGHNLQIASRLIPRETMEKSPMELAQALVNVLDNGIGRIIGCFVAGGKVAEEQDNAVNPVWRKALWQLVLPTSWLEGTSLMEQDVKTKALTHANSLLRDLTQESGAYLNEADFNEPNWQESFFGVNFERLKSIKKVVDPNKLFRLTFIRIAKKKSTESFSSVPYIASLLNCILWVLYGSPINKNATLVVTINGLGTVLNVIYVLLFLFYARKSPKALYRIFKTKSVEFLPFYLCLTVFINSALWFAYALLKHDIYILVPDEKEAEESESPDLESGIELPKQNGKFVDVALNTSTMATQS
ncbi:uncharacterized FAD-linked oxidoreductase ARB_02478 [Selaginella moellendorffii]|uniref:uncharacterized FAD-linked oxidoreductase ARB_02478 n=1 Tax=Selaginella moellendorffii TaxID=88036 RepID=UPI000D1CA3F0|nr:uncharacterized FAD-linked oxidoreductase ARB_02478 [Selaginella moellendorffii]|eukprot:XP_024541102.1 uncharacterized FAD-linked oxidoreductase ARB_02478 [Selaginella moellendorffii]